LEVFPVVKNILNKITNTDVYKSPTDMGVNSIGKCIFDDEVIQEAAKKEIMRRYYKSLVDAKLGSCDEDIPSKIKLLINELDIDKDILRVINESKKKENKSKKRAMAIELDNGKIITGRETKLLTPAASLILNCIKYLTDIPDEINLLSPSVLNPILKLKKEHLNDGNKLNLNDVLIALGICSATNPIVEKALKNLKKLKNCDAHATYIVEKSDLSAIRSLMINLTCDPIFYDNY